MNSRGISHGFLLSSALQPLPQNPPPWQRVEETTLLNLKKQEKTSDLGIKSGPNSQTAKQPNSQTTNPLAARAKHVSHLSGSYAFFLKHFCWWHFSPAKESNSVSSLIHLDPVTVVSRSSHLHVVVVNSSTWKTLGPLALPCSSYTSVLSP